MKSFPFTSLVDYDAQGYPQFDRAIDSFVFRNVLKQYVTNGVFPNPSTNFQVVSNNDMTITVQSGSCIINGATAYEEKNRVLTVQSADTKDRIDTVVLRLNDSIDFRNVDLYIVKGTPADEPVPPELTRTTDIYELGIANLFINSNTPYIAQERITDTRLNKDRCGYAMFMTEIDTQTFYDQIQAELTKFKTVYETDIEEWTSTQQGSYLEWLETMKDHLSDVDATRLQLEIDAINEEIATVILENELTIGNTELTFTNDAITDDCQIDIYTDDYSVSPKKAVQENDTLTLTFKAQTKKIRVKVVIK